MDRTGPTLVQHIRIMAWSGIPDHERGLLPSVPRNVICQFLSPLQYWARKEGKITRYLHWTQSIFGKDQHVFLYTLVHWQVLF